MSVGRGVLPLRDERRQCVEIGLSPVAGAGLLRLRADNSPLDVQHVAAVQQGVERSRSFSMRDTPAEGPYNLSPPLTGSFVAVAGKFSGVSHELGWYLGAWSVLMRLQHF